MTSLARLLAPSTTSRIPDFSPFTTSVLWQITNRKTALRQASTHAPFSFLAHYKPVQGTKKHLSLRHSVNVRVSVCVSACELLCVCVLWMCTSPKWMKVETDPLLSGSEATLLCCVSSISPHTVGVSGDSPQKCSPIHICYTQTHTHRCVPGVCGVTVKLLPYHLYSSSTPRSNAATASAGLFDR